MQELFISEGIHRLQAGGFPGWKKAKNDSDAQRKNKSHYND